MNVHLVEPHTLEPDGPVSLKALDESLLDQGTRELCDRDPDLARIFEMTGTPPLWPREEGFPTLTFIILEQQVSLASARAAFEKLTAQTSSLTPRSFLELDDERLKTIGFSRQKAGYVRGLAAAILEEKLDLEELKKLDDKRARAQLVSIKGIGPWTADIYLLRALLRPDVWPVGDLALAVAAQGAKNLEARPGPEDMERIGRPWRPWRAVAARMLWLYYLKVLTNSKSDVP